MKLEALVLATTALNFVGAARAHTESHARRAARLKNRQNDQQATPPLAALTSGMSSRPALLPTATYSAGMKAPLSGAPPLPTPFNKAAINWPPIDKIPSIDSEEVRGWMKELDGVDIPDLSLTVDPGNESGNGGCAGNPAARDDAANRGWWTCGGHTRATDVTTCPQKGTWGLSFDDGPSPYTQYLLNYLEEVDLSATFFLVGSRVIEHPAIVVEEYMKGHELSIHGWSHKGLTSLSNEQIVAELGWTRKAIQEVTGVTPTTMRPPLGDIDDRVRAITLAMGMVPIMWSRTSAGGTFDTNDWKIPGGKEDGVASFEAIKTLVTEASKLETGFIVLQHDLYDSSVIMGAGYTLPYALNFEPKLNLVSIGECIRKPGTDLYFESNKNASFPPAQAVRSVRSDNGAASTLFLSPWAALSKVSAIAAASVLYVVLLQ